MATLPSILCNVQGEPHAPRWTRDQYYQMAEMGLFEGRHVELIEGEIVEMTPMNEPHWAAVVEIPEVLREALGSGYRIAVQVPLVIPESEPEPDILVLRRGTGRAQKASALQSVELVIEVSQSTLAYDRTTKAALYARAGIAEYWIVNLEDRQLEVHRAPVGEKYTRIALYSENEAVSPLAASNAEIQVADLLP